LHAPRIQGAYRKEERCDFFRAIPAGGHASTQKI